MPFQAPIFTSPPEPPYATPPVAEVPSDRLYLKSIMGVGLALVLSIGPLVAALV